jgi:hypothetical protein
MVKDVRFWSSIAKTKLRQKLDGQKWTFFHTLIHYPRMSHKVYILIIVITIKCFWYRNHFVVLYNIENNKFWARCLCCYTSLVLSKMRSTQVFVYRDGCDERGKNEKIYLHQIILHMYSKFSLMNRVMWCLMLYLPHNEIVIGQRHSNEFNASAHTPSVPYWWSPGKRVCEGNHCSLATNKKGQRE